MAREQQDTPREGAREPEFEVRPARQGDREAVLAFCAHTWDDGDYIAGAWDEWMADPSGVPLVGVLAGTPVALTYVKLVAPDEAWLEGMRVDPRYRRSGFGRIMTSRALVTARDRGAVVARLMTDSDNVASQGMIARFGFVRVAELMRYHGPAGIREDEEWNPDMRLSQPGPAALDRIWEWLEHSNMTPLTGGLRFDGWEGRALTEPELGAYLAAGHVQLLEEWGTIQAVAIPVLTPGHGSGGPELDVRYMDGQADAIGRLAVALRAQAARQGARRVSLWLPDLLILRDAMDGAGYVPSDTPMWVYAREL